jgi:hypothetical protein
MDYETDWMRDALAEGFNLEDVLSRIRLSMLC